MQKILAEISNDTIRNYHDPQHEPGKKSKLDKKVEKGLAVVIPE